MRNDYRTSSLEERIDVLEQFIRDNIEVMVNHSCRTCMYQPRSKMCDNCKVGGKLVNWLQNL